MYVILTYVDEGIAYKDIGMDIVATPHCIVSLKISGRTDELGVEYWKTFVEQFELVRHLIENKYGTIQFPSSGSRIWWSVFVDNFFWLLVISISAFILSVIYRSEFFILPGSITKKYSIFIMIVSFIMVSVTILANEWIGFSITLYRYESTPHFVLIFVVHLWAYLTNRPKVVAFALWLIVASLLTQIGFWILGWSTLKTGNLLAVLIGFVLVTYTLVKSSSLKRKES